MSYTDPYYQQCCICGESATDWRTVRVGDHQAHQVCVDESGEVVRCAYCSQLTLADDAGDWIRCPDGRVCPQCAADTEPVTNLDNLISDLKT